MIMTAGFINRGVRASMRKSLKKFKIIWNAWKDVLFNALKVWKLGFVKITKVWNQIKIWTLTSLKKGRQDAWNLKTMEAQRRMDKKKRKKTKKLRKKNWEWQKKKGIRITKCCQFKGAVLEDVGSLVDDEDIEHDVVLVDVDVGLGVDRIGEASQLGDLGKWEYQNKLLLWNQEKSLWKGQQSVITFGILLHTFMCISKWPLCGLALCCTDPLICIILHLVIGHQKVCNLHVLFSGYSYEVCLHWGMSFETTVSAVPLSAVNICMVLNTVASGTIRELRHKKLLYKLYLAKFGSGQVCYFLLGGRSHGSQGQAEGQLIFRAAAVCLGQELKEVDWIVSLDAPNLLVKKALVQEENVIWNTKHWNKVCIHS